MAEEILKKPIAQAAGRALGLSYVLIYAIWTWCTIAHRTAVMLRGSFVAFDKTDAIFEGPYHPYTEQLVTAVLIMRSDWLDGRTV